MYKILANLAFKSKMVHYLPSCHSTNEIAANLLAQGPNEGELVITDNQTDGRGQRGNYWESEPYLNLTFSLILKPKFLALQNQFRLTQVVSISLASVIQSYVPNIVKIKWPNDIYVDDKKIAGILIQNVVKSKEIEHSIIGIGLNVNQAVFLTTNAISLTNLTGKIVDLNSLFNEVVNAVSENYIQLQNRNHKLLSDEYKKILYKINVEELFESDVQFSGKIIGTDQLGRLLIETSNGVKCFQNKEVKFVSL